ncbi:MAG: Ig-like domain-containing protein [Muribaculaceae bacterium]|nr:Ig-like domain-containing protein [Roseburia sp.]MCM1432086.1 Ig-like domain-containing protein [Muribaculaceae bacterium]MCM1492114.1 Ig-like domain-containing protein [Muribaculaceae bacterium]
MKRFLKLLVIVLCVSMLTPSNVPYFGVECVEAAQKIKLNYTKRTIYEGDSFTLKLKGTKKKVTWSSSNKKVATVSSKGVVKGKSGGSSKKTCKITAKAGGKKYVCKVTVKVLPEEEEDEDTEEDEAAEEEDSSVSDPAPSDDIAKNIAALKAYIQKYGYTNGNGDKTIKGSGDNFTPVIAYEKDRDVLCFALVANNGVKAGLSMEMKSADNSAPMVASFTLVGTGFVFIAEGTVIPSEYTVDKGCYFTFAENYSQFSESDIQEVSNSTLKLAFVSWEYTLMENCGLTMKDIGFKEIDYSAL